MNLLYSTTRQWNVGDEFICSGVKNLVNALIPESACIIYNRNPLTTPQRWTDRLPWVRKHRPNDNSWHFQYEGVIDAVIFAGSPEWRGGRRVGPLLDWIIRNQLPSIFLGLGSGGPFKLHGPIEQIMKRQTRLITSRDRITHESVSQRATSHLLPCPSIYALGLPSPRPSPVGSIKKIALILQASVTRWQSVPRHLQSWMREQYQHLSRKYDVHCVGHFIDDLALAKEWGVPIRYSGDSSDYAKFLEDCDLVVSPRVHGCGLASAMGKPSIVIQHDGRAETAERMGALMVQSGTNLLELVEKIDWNFRAQSIHQIRTEALPVYLDLLEKAFASIKASVPR